MWDNTTKTNIKSLVSESSTLRKMFELAKGVLLEHNSTFEKNNKR